MYIKLLLTAFLALTLTTLLVQGQYEPSQYVPRNDRRSYPGGPAPWFTKDNITPALNRGYLAERARRNRLGLNHDGTTPIRRPANYQKITNNKYYAAPVKRNGGSPYHVYGYVRKN